MKFLVILIKISIGIIMKRACSLNANTDEYFTCEFHPANKKQIIFG